MKILSISHNHSSIHPGGTERCAEALHRSYGRAEGVESTLLAGADPDLTQGLPGTAISALPSERGTFLFRAPGYDPVHQSRSSLEPLLYDLAWFLRDVRPTIVHIHHFNAFGLEILKLIRNEVPRARIVVTLHDYYLICANDGLLFTRDGKRCRNPGVDDCAACFPDHGSVQFSMRRSFVLQHLALVDDLVAPSQFLKDRFVEWGVPEHKIHLISNGIDTQTAASGTPKPDTSTFGLFGNLRQTKGSIIALEAFAEAAQSAPPGRRPTLHVHGSALYQPEDVRDAITSIAEKADGAIRLHGQYAPEEQVDALGRVAWVLVPSIWWENAPLVIGEAFSRQRPVLCSDIGGMAEAVRHGVDGLHVRAGDIDAWRDTILEISGDDTLWAKLSGGVRPVRTAEEAAADYLALFGHRKAA